MLCVNHLETFAYANRYDVSVHQDLTRKNVRDHISHNRFSAQTQYYSSFKKDVHRRWKMDCLQQCGAEQVGRNEESDAGYLLGLEE